MRILFDILTTLLLALGAWKAVELYPVLRYWWPRRQGISLRHLLESISPRALDLDQAAFTAAARARQAERARDRASVR